MIEQLQMRLGQIGIQATIDRQAVACLLEQKQLDPAEGARPLRQAIRQQIEDPLAQQYLSGTFSRGDSIFCEFSRELIVRKL